MTETTEKKEGKRLEVGEKAGACPSPSKTSNPFIFLNFFLVSKKKSRWDLVVFKNSDYVGQRKFNFAL